MSTPLPTVHNLPIFSQIVPENIEQQVNELLAHHRAAIQQLLNNKKSYTWNNLAKPLEDLEDELDKLWGPIAHLNAVMNCEALREKYHLCLPKLSEYATFVGQNEQLYNAFKRLAVSEEFSTLDVAQQKVITDALLDFQLSGVALPQQSIDCRFTTAKFNK